MNGMTHPAPLRSRVLRRRAGANVLGRVPSPAPPIGGLPPRLHGRQGGPLRIAVDFDGVLFDHIPYVLRGFRDAHGIDLAAEGLRHWDFFQYRAVREQELSWNCVRSVLLDIETDPRLHEEGLRDPMAKHVMQQWRDQGHEVFVVTAREEVSRNVTQLFLNNHGVPHDDLRMNVALKTGYDILIDDAPHNVLMAAADGGLSLLMDHPYNRDVPCKGNPLRVHDWRQVDRTVAQVLAVPA